MPDIRLTVGNTLVLNATYEPLCVVSVRRAAILVLSAKAVCVSDGDGVLHSVREELPVPSVVRLTRYVRVPYRTHVGLSRRAIFARDGGRCAYCRGPAETIDHVMPRSRGGPHAWDNVVAACARCNHSKGDKTPSELGWRLHSMPAAPKGTAWRVLGHLVGPARGRLAATTAGIPDDAAGAGTR
jgi:5-methylcytosine-specific restriction endonuclease McrA